jgi:DNA-binding Lrp family transcriptional regulator
VQDFTKTGQNHHRAKLSNAEVDALREDYEEGLLSFAALAEKYDISKSHAHRIVRGLTR